MRTQAGRTLRIGQPADAAALAEMERTAKAVPFLAGWPESQHRAFMASENFRYLIYEADGVVRGYAVLAGLTLPSRAVEIMRMLVDGSAFGVGGDFLDAIVRFGFGELAAHRIWTDCFGDNRTVRRTLVRFGFLEEGVMRDAIFHDGRLRDIVLFGLLEGDERRSLPSRRRFTTA